MFLAHPVYLALLALILSIFTFYTQKKSIVCEFIQKLSNYIHYQIVYNTSYHSPYIHLHLVILNRNKLLRPSFTSFVRLGGENDNIWGLDREVSVFYHFDLGDDNV